MRAPSRIKTLFAIIIIIVISLWSVWKVAERPKDVVTDRIDGALIVWILNQTISKIPNDLENIFQGNIYYPHNNTMAYSELFVPSAVISMIPTKLTGEPVVAASTALIIGQIMTMLIVYLLFNDLTDNKPVALLGALALGLSGIRMHYYGHLQMWNMQWWLLSVWLLWRFFKNKKAWQVYASALFVVVQAWESLLPVFFVLLTSGLLVWQNKNIFLKFSKHFMSAGFAAVVLAFPVFWTYLGVSKEFAYTRTIRDAAHFALSFEQLGSLFFSPVLFLLFGVALMFSPVVLKKSKINLRWFWLVLILSFVLALGPVLKWQGQTIKVFEKLFIPLPYGILYYLLPGFKALRTPSRWLFVSSFAMSGIIALTFNGIKLKHKNIIVVLAIVLVLIGGSRVPRVHEFPKVSDYPEVYKWLNTQKDEVIVELPIYSWGAGGKVELETLRMVYSINHGKKLVNGYSGFTPPEWMGLVSNITTDFPSSDLEDRLRARGASLIIIRKDKYSVFKIKQFYEWGEGKLVWEDESHSVFRI